MNRRRTDRRRQGHLELLFKMAAPGCAPWRLPENGCPTGKRRWPTGRAADAALRDAQQTRIRRAKGNYRGKFEIRKYACADCDGFHLTSMSAEEYDGRRHR